MTWNFGRGFCQTSSGRQPSPAFLHTYTFSSLLIIILLSSEKNDFFSQLFSRDYFRFFPTPREPFFFHSLFLSPTFSWKLCQVLLANGFVLFCLYFTGISTSVPHVLTLTDLCNFQYSQGVIFVLGLPLLRRFSISPRYK